MQDPRPAARESRDQGPPGRSEDVRALAAFKPLVLGGYASGHGFKTVPVIELFSTAVPLPMARWPNEGFVKVADVAGPTTRSTDQGKQVGRLKYEGDRPSRWLDEKDGLLYGYWFWGWADSYERIASIDPRKRRDHAGAALGPLRLPQGAALLRRQPAGGDRRARRVVPRPAAGILYL